MRPDVPRRPPLIDLSAPIEEGIAERSNVLLAPGCAPSSLVARSDWATFGQPPVGAVPVSAIRSGPRAIAGRRRIASDSLLENHEKRGLTSEPILDYDPENGFRRGACPRF